MPGQGTERRRREIKDNNVEERDLPISTTKPREISGFFLASSLLFWAVVGIAATALCSFSFLCWSGVPEFFKIAPAPAATVAPVNENYFNCTPMLSGSKTPLPDPDVPHSTAELSDLAKMREYIRKQQPGIEAYYEQQDKLEAFIRKKFQRKPSVLELGGNNGWFADPLFPIMMAHEWPAIIVEALPHQYALLVSNYAKKYDGCLWTGLQLIHQAVLDEKKQVSMSYKITESWQRGGGSVLRHQNEPGWKTMMVDGNTLEGILSPLAYSEIDMIQIDVEGLDEAMLKQVDSIMVATSIYPRMVCIETCDKGYCSEFFTKHGFTQFTAPGEICGVRGF